jgi:hypothetical protein
MRLCGHALSLTGLIGRRAVEEIAAEEHSSDVLDAQVAGLEGVRAVRVPVLLQREIMPAEVPIERVVH